MLLCIEEILQEVSIPGGHFQCHTRERQPLTGIRSSIGLVSPKSMQGVKSTQLKKSLRPLLDILNSSVSLIMLRATKLTGHQLRRAPLRRFHSSSTSLPRTVHVLHSQIPLVDYKPPPDLDLAWKKLRTSAAEMFSEFSILSKIKLGIDGNPIWSYEKDPDSGEVSEWRGVWPEHGEVFSGEFAVIAKMQCIFTDGNPCIRFTDDNEGQERRESAKSDFERLLATMGIVYGCFAIFAICILIYHVGEKILSKKRAGETIHVPEPGGDAEPSIHEKSTWQEEHGPSASKGPDV